MDSRYLKRWKDRRSGASTCQAILGFCVITLLLCSEYSPSLSAQSLQDLIFVQIPAQAKLKSRTGQNFYSPLHRYVDGARIVILQKSVTKPVNLTPEFTAACDSDVSFDGKTIIFAAKKSPEDSWQIWRMNYDGSQKVQITHEEGDCYAPVHAGNRFYLNDPQPTPQIIYVGTTHGWKNEHEVGPATALYGTDPKGKTIHRLTFNLHSDFSPDILPDGRILFTSLQHYGDRFQPTGVFALFAINNDGTDLMPFYGNHEMPFYKDMAKNSATDDRVYFIESDQAVWLGGGDIAYISRRRPLQSYNTLSHEDNGLFHSPCPVPDHGLIASFRSKMPSAVFGIYQINPTSGKRQKKIFHESGWHSIDAHVFMSHPKVKGRSNWLIPGAKTGVFYCLNSYRTNLREDGEIAPEAIKYVRVIEGLPQKERRNKSEIHSEADNEARQQKVSGNVFGPRRILGVAPVEKDGSFQIRVPAETPLSFQLLDSDLLALRSQKAWIWVMGNENRGCIGCHEDRELTPPNKLVDAVIKPPADLTLPPERRRTVDFRHQIAPIIKSKCSTSGCHVSGKARLDLEITQRTEYDIYKTLTEPIPGHQNERYVVPGKARESPLIWHLFGKKLGCKHTNYTGKITQIHSEKLLKSRERILFIEWIDLGAQWDLRSTQTTNSL